MVAGEDIGTAILAVVAPLFMESTCLLCLLCLGMLHILSDSVVFLGILPGGSHNKSYVNLELKVREVGYLQRRMCVVLDTDALPTERTSDDCPTVLRASRR